MECPALLPGVVPLSSSNQLPPLKLYPQVSLSQVKGGTICQKSCRCGRCAVEGSMIESRQQDVL